MQGICAAGIHRLSTARPCGLSSSSLQDAYPVTTRVCDMDLCTVTPCFLQLFTVAESTVLSARSAWVSILDIYPRNFAQNVNYSLKSLPLLGNVPISDPCQKQTTKAGLRYCASSYQS